MNKLFLILLMVAVNCFAVIPTKDFTVTGYRYGGNVTTKPESSQEWQYTLTASPISGATGNNVLVTTGIVLPSGRVSDVSQFSLYDGVTEKQIYVEVTSRYFWLDNSIRSIRLQTRYNTADGQKNLTLKYGKSSSLTRLADENIDNGRVVTAIPNRAGLKENIVYLTMQPDDYIRSGIVDTDPFNTPLPSVINTVNKRQHWFEYQDIRLRQTYSSWSKDSTKWSPSWYTAPRTYSDLFYYDALANKIAGTITNTGGCSDTEFYTESAITTVAITQPLGDLRHFRESVLANQAFIKFMKTSTPNNTAWYDGSPSLSVNHSPSKDRNRYAFDCRFLSGSSVETKAVDIKYVSAYQPFLYLAISGDKEVFQIAAGENVSTVFTGLGEQVRQGLSFGIKSQGVVNNNPFQYGTPAYERYTERNPAFQLSSLVASWWITQNPTLKTEIDNIVNRLWNLYQNNPHGYGQQGSAKYPTYPHMMHSWLGHDDSCGVISSSASAAVCIADTTGGDNVISPWMSPFLVGVFNRYYYNGATGSTKDKLRDMIKWQGRIVYEYGATHSPKHLINSTDSIFNRTTDDNLVSNDFVTPCNNYAPPEYKALHPCDPPKGYPTYFYAAQPTITELFVAEKVLNPTNPNRATTIDVGIAWDNGYGYRKDLGADAAILNWLIHETDPIVKSSAFNMVKTHYEWQRNRYAAVSNPTDQPRYIGLYANFYPQGLYERVRQQVEGN